MGRRGAGRDGRGRRRPSLPALADSTSKWQRRWVRCWGGGRLRGEGRVVAVAIQSSPTLGPIMGSRAHKVAPHPPPMIQRTSEKALGNFHDGAAKNGVLPHLTFTTRPEFSGLTSRSLLHTNAKPRPAWGARRREQHHGARGRLPHHLAPAETSMYGVVRGGRGRTDGCPPYGNATAQVLASWRRQRGRGGERHSRHGRSDLRRSWSLSFISSPSTGVALRSRPPVGIREFLCGVPQPRRPCPTRGLGG